MEFPTLHRPSCESFLSHTERKITAPVNYTVNGKVAFHWSVLKTLYCIAHILVCSHLGKKFRLYSTRICLVVTHAIPIFGYRHFGRTNMTQCYDGVGINKLVICLRHCFQNSEECFHLNNAVRFYHSDDAKNFK